MIASLAAWLRRLVHHIATGVTVVITWCRSAWESIAERHRERLISEPGYRGSIAGGLTAVVGTITAQPAMAAAIGVWVAETLRTPAASRSGRRLWDEDWDDDDPDTLSSPRTWTYR